MKDGTGEERGFTSERYESSEYREPTNLSSSYEEFREDLEPEKSLSSSDNDLDVEYNAEKSRFEGEGDLGRGRDILAGCDVLKEGFGGVIGGMSGRDSSSEDE